MTLRNKTSGTANESPVTEYTDIHVCRKASSLRHFQNFQPTKFFRQFSFGTFELQFQPTVTSVFHFFNYSKWPLYGQCTIKLLQAFTLSSDLEFSIHGKLCDFVVKRLKHSGPFSITFKSQSNL